MNNDADSSLDGLLFFTLFFLIFPFFNLCATEVTINAIDHKVTIGQFVLHLFFGAIIFMIGLVCLVTFIFSLRKYHVPFKFRQIFAWVAGALIVSSVVSVYLTFPDSCKITTSDSCSSRFN
jgi:hypothetical protein